MNNVSQHVIRKTSGKTTKKPSRVVTSSKSQSKSQAKSQSKLKKSIPKKTLMKAPSYLLPAKTPATSLAAGRLTVENYDDFVWEKFQYLVVDNFPHDFFSSMSNATQETLSTLEFSGLLLFENLKLSLIHCYSLKELILTNIVLRYNNKEDFIGKQHRESRAIDVSRLTTLKLRNYSKTLTVDELHCLQFLFWRVAFKNFISFSVERIKRQSHNEDNIQTARSSVSTSSSTSKGRGRQEGQKQGVQEEEKEEIPEPADEYSSHAIPSIMSYFMVKHALGLKTLEITRNLICLFESDVEKSDIETLQLETFKCDIAAKGYEKLLSIQNRLKVFHCFNSSPVKPSTFESVMVAVQTNEETLVDIRINHRFIFDTTVEFVAGGGYTQKIPDILRHDCGVYKHCENLKKLNINVSLTNFDEEEGGDYDDVEDEGDAENYHVSISNKDKHDELNTSATNRENDVGPDQGQQQQAQQQQHEQPRPGEIVNINFLPLALSSLILRFDTISDAEIEQLIDRLDGLDELKYLVVFGNPSMPYKLKFSWICAILHHPMMHIFEFHFCKIQPSEAGKFITLFETQPRFKDELEVRPSSIIYWKGSQQTNNKPPNS